MFGPVSWVFRKTCNEGWSTSYVFFLFINLFLLIKNKYLKKLKIFKS